MHRHRIGRWHVGQLVMVWVGVLLGAAALAIGALAVGVNVEGDQTARAAVVRDSLVRADPVRWRAVQDTLLAMSDRRAAEWEVDLKASQLGVLRLDAYRPSALATRTIGLRWGGVALLLTGAVALLGYAIWATWTWFGARATPLPLQRAAGAGD